MHGQGCIRLGNTWASVSLPFVSADKNEGETIEFGKSGFEGAWLLCIFQDVDVLNTLTFVNIGTF